MMRIQILLTDGLVALVERKSKAERKTFNKFVCEALANSVGSGHSILYEPPYYDLLPNEDDKGQLNRKEEICEIFESWLARAYIALSNLLQRLKGKA